MTGTTNAESGALVDDDTASGDKAATRRLNSRAGPLYVPAKAQHCQRCAYCKQYKDGSSVPLPSSCRNACKNCPDAVVLGAERLVSIEVDGITAIEYVRDESAGGQGRALQSSNDLGNGITVVQYATTVFEGEAGMRLQFPQLLVAQLIIASMHVCTSTTQGRLSIRERHPSSTI